MRVCVCVCVVLLLLRTIYASLHPVGLSSLAKEVTVASRKARLFE